MQTFHSPYVLCASGNPTTDNFRNEGFHVCEDGMVLLDTHGRLLTIVERGFVDHALRSMPLASIRDIEFQFIVSANNRFKAG